MDPLIRPAVLVVNGPSLDRLGTRQPEIYGTTTLAEIERALRERGAALGVEVECFQSNDEEAVVGAVAGAPARGIRGIIINPAALSHFSHPLREAIRAAGVPVVEVHISNIHAREPYRRLSLVSGVATGVIAGLGANGYLLALEAIAGMVGIPHEGT